MIHTLYNNNKMVSMMGWRKVTIKDFIDVSNNKHNFKYDYSASVFELRDLQHIKLGTRIKIKCKTHQQYFLQLPGEHLIGTVSCIQCAQEKRKNVMIEKYGVEHALQITKFKEKFKTTMNNKYGVDYAMQSNVLKNKCIDSLVKNHGVRHPSQSKVIYAKRNSVMIEKYGVEHAMQSDKLKQRHNTSLLASYGVIVPLKSEFIQYKFKQTMKQRYGKEYTAEVDWLFKQMKQTNIEKYGVEYPLQNKQIKEMLRTKMEICGKWIPKELLTAAQLYYKEVVKYTNKQPINLLENFNKRGLAGVNGAYHIDHMVSIKFGFENFIPPYIIGNINNLEMLQWKENIYKSSKCSIDINVLINKILFL